MIVELTIAISMIFKIFYDSVLRLTQSGNLFNLCKNHISFWYLCHMLCRLQTLVNRCREPAWGTPPMTKVMRKAARHTQRRDWAWGVPLEILQHLPPKLESAYFTTLCSHLHLWLYGGLFPTTSFGEGVNLELQLVIIPGRDRSVSTYKLLWRFSSLPDRLVRPHVIVHSLPTVRGTRC